MRRAASLKQEQSARVYLRGACVRRAFWIHKITCGYKRFHTRLHTVTRGYTRLHAVTRAHLVDACDEPVEE